IIRTCLERPNDRVIGWCVSQPYSEIPQPALVTDTADGAPRQLALEFFGAPCEQLQQPGAIQSVADTKLVERARPCETIPWTHQLAVVATVYSIAHEASELERNASFVLDCEIGNAAARIQLIGCDDRLRWTDVDATTACAAVVGLMPVHRKRQ